ncbi:potassium-transporting ATPase subunit C [Streptomyces sp. NPDC014623]|uniref:potassium-transporting ATPase subunit C n=1 Tax=Streptomyces sp. NPDC014623 TaxID=3364875 RepID=UPI003701B2E4
MDAPLRNTTRTIGAGPRTSLVRSAVRGTPGHRVAERHGLPVRQVAKSVDEYTEDRTLGSMGDPRADVLELSIALRSAGKDRLGPGAVNSGAAVPDGTAALQGAPHSGGPRPSSPSPPFLVHLLIPQRPGTFETFDHIERKHRSDLRNRHA